MNIKRITIFLSLLLLISCMCFPVSAQDEYDSEEADSLLIWGYSCRHALFDDAAPDRPVTISPRLWYMGHKEPAETYKVEIVFNDFAYITKEAVQDIRETYAKEHGFDSWEAWRQEYPDELDGTGDVHRYLEQQKLQWHIEHNQALIDQYMRPEDAYEWKVLTLTCNLVCELTWERIVELAEAGDGRTVFIEYDREALTGGISVFPEFSVPIETQTITVTTQEETTELPTTQTTAEETEITDAELTEPEIRPSDGAGNCNSDISLSVCSVCVMVLCGVIVCKKKE